MQGRVSGASSVSVGLGSWPTARQLIWAHGQSPCGLPSLARAERVRQVLLWTLALVLVVGLASGCAHHPMKMDRARALMAEEDYEAAFAEVTKICKSEDDVLCLLERGLLLHYSGRYSESNEVLDRAEILIEDLYTRSLSREAAAFLTSDLARAYVPRPFEQVLINYFRALNYVFLGLDDDALVECRKASAKLARYSEDEKRPYRQDAFLEYLTGLLYEWGGDANSAFISYRNARAAYAAYGEAFGLGAPRDLDCDLVRTAEALGFESELDSALLKEYGHCASETAKIVVIVEQGFVPATEEISLNVPIFRSEADHAHDDPFDFSLGIGSRMYGGYYDASDVAYFLRIAVPVYPETAPGLRPPEIHVDSLVVAPSEAEDVSAIARAELEADMPVIFARTLARAIIKYKASDAAGHKWGDLLGKLVNFLTAATEQADLRAWLSLPRSIYVATIYTEPGPHTVAIGAPVWSAAGRGPDGTETAGFQEVQVDARAGATSFVRFRRY